MREVKFKGEVWKTGNGYVITVPAAFIRHSLINKKKVYEIILRQTDLTPKSDNAEMDETINAPIAQPGESFFFDGVGVSAFV